MIEIDNQAAHERAALVIAAGGVMAFRTDTFYGLGVDPLNQNAVRAIRNLKGREEVKPILLLISDASLVDRFIVSRSKLFDAVAEHFWPGPLTLISLARPELPEELTAGSGTIGVRLPDDERVRDLVRACGGALTATSANPSGDAPARTVEEVQDYFPEGIDLIVDGGEVTVTEPSTVLDVSADAPRLVREGAISKEQIRRGISGIV
jgi:L-threonylcarbamoyladenylate synthase